MECAALLACVSKLQSEGVVVVNMLESAPHIGHDMQDPVWSHRKLSEELPWVS